MFFMNRDEMTQLSGLRLKYQQLALARVMILML